MTFALNPRIEADSLLVGRHTAFQLRLVADERFFWVLLIPEQEGATELHDLNPEMNAELMQIAATLGATLQRSTGAEKINIATIGNVVSQFHLHVIARHANDEAWPAPVWGFGAPATLSPATRAGRLAILEEFLVALA